MKFKKINESSFDFNATKGAKKQDKKKKQRTKQWREDRRGNWTGSQLKNLMSSVQGKARLAWDNLDRVFAFGATAIKYLYSNAMERKTGRWIDDGDGSWAMQYGTKVEPLIKKATKEILKDMGVLGKLKAVGYKKFPNMPNAGVSSDSVVVLDGKTVASVEMKACTNWGTHYERTFDSTDDKSNDFWQLQGQMIAHEVDICYYAVAQPPANIKDYLFYDGDIMDLHEQFKKECKVSVEIVKKSKLHQAALIKRIIIAEETIGDWLAGDCTERLDVLLNTNIKIYEESPEKFDNYVPPVKFRKELKQNNTDEIKKIEVCLPAWSESDTSWCLLTESSNDKRAWSKQVWFPKKICKITPKADNPTIGIIEMPKWFYDKNFKK